MCTGRLEEKRNDMQRTDEQCGREGGPKVDVTQREIAGCAHHD